MARVSFYSDNLELVGELRGLAGGQKRPALVLCTGMGLIKEVWLPEYARRLNRAGYITLLFDYRSFGESEGQPRRRLVPQLEVRDAQSAVSFLQSLEQVDVERIGAFGVSLGASVATALAGVDPRVKATVALAGPMNLHRIWSGLPNFEGFFSKVQAARNACVLGEDVTYVSLLKLLSSDPDTVAFIEETKKQITHWKTDVTFESLVDLIAFNPEATVGQISPRSIAWIYPEKDDLIAGSEARSAFEKAAESKKLLKLEGATHVDIYKDPATFEKVVSLATALFTEHL